MGDLNVLGEAAAGETDLGLAIREGRADAGFGVEAAARQFGLSFKPLHRERYDLLMTRRDYFEAPVQTLLRFSRKPAFQKRSKALGGYDVTNLGQVRYNAP